MGREGYAVVRALASHQCSPGWKPSLDATSGLNLLLVLSLALRGLFLGTPIFPFTQKPTLTNSNSVWNNDSLKHILNFTVHVNANFNSKKSVFKLIKNVCIKYIAENCRFYSVLALNTPPTLTIILTWLLNAMSSAWKRQVWVNFTFITCWVQWLAVKLVGLTFK